MLKFLFRHAAPTVCALLILSPVAQAAEQKAAEESAQPVLTAPFDRYHPWRDEPVRDWRETNEQVGKTGGWRAYLRETQQGDSGAAQGHHAH